MVSFNNHRTCNFTVFVWLLLFFICYTIIIPFTLVFNFYFFQQNLLGKKIASQKVLKCDINNKQYIYKDS